MEAIPKSKSKTKHKKSHLRQAKPNETEESGLLCQDEKQASIVATVSLENELMYGLKGRSLARCDEVVAEAEEKERLLASPAKSVQSEDSFSAVNSLAPLVTNIQVNPPYETGGFLSNAGTAQELNCSELYLNFKESAPEFEGVESNYICVDTDLTFLPPIDSSLSEGKSVSDSSNSCVNELLENSEDFAELSRLANEPNEVSTFTDVQLLSVYRNDELEVIESYTDKFLDEELKGGCNVATHPLYVMLQTYLRVREKRTASNTIIDSLLKECEDIQSRLWVLETASITESGECQDGNPVEATHEYQIGKFDRGLLSSLGKNLSTIRELVSDEHALVAHTCELTKLEIEHYLHTVTAQFVYLPHNAPVALTCQSVPYSTAHLQAAISVLFAFQRQLIKDEEFVSETRNWLTFLVSVLLRVANWQSHLFLLNHILRCPSGVSQWAVSLVQLPQPVYNSANAAAHLNHMISTLAVIVSPVRGREQFLPHMTRSVEDSDDVWVVVSNDDEEEEDAKKLSETDLIALLNQIPVDALFRQILQIIKKDEDSYCSLSSSQIMRVFAIMKVLLRVLRHGLQNDVSLQLAKRLASMVNHTVQYATDVWQAFLQENNELHDKCLLERLQVEYNDIMLNACHVLLITPFKTILQFLASLPFKTVSLSVIWKIYHMIFLPQHSLDSVCVSILEWWAGVEEVVPKMSEDELYYVLTCAANMALARSHRDWVFVKMVTIHLLQIGYLNASTRERSFKTARTLLSNLTLKNPNLISVIINKLKLSASRTGNLSIYLFRELPVELWVPSVEDLETFEYWLLSCPFTGPESNLARYILSNMHWGTNPNCSNELLLKREVHCQVSMMVVKMAMKYCPESTNSSTTSVLTETIKQLTNSAVGKTLSGEQNLSLWVWEMLLKLRIHLLDQPDSVVWATLDNVGLYFSKLPSLEAASTELNVLTEGLSQKQVTAMYLALVLTSQGHSVPLICNSGFDLMATLVQCHRYIPVVNLIQHIFPLFLDCPQSLLSSDDFLKAVSGILVADKTFIRTAKNLLIPAYPGLVLTQFGDMIQSLLENYRRYNLPSPLSIAHVWLQVLCKVWSVDTLAVSFLMDIILRAAFFRPEMKAASTEVLCDLLQSVSSMGKQAKFSLTSWVSASGPPSLISRSTPDTPWFAMFVLELEELAEMRSGLWRQVLLELSLLQGRANVDSAIKKSCSALKIATVSSSSLSIYRWSQQALDTPVDHPLLPLIWQKFFLLYLARVPSSSWTQEVGCVGSKFFEGITNLNYLKKIKRKLRDCQDYYEGKCANTTQVISDERKKWLNNIAKLYATYSLWLEEPRLHDPDLYIPSLPPQYDPFKLSKIFSADTKLWYEYIDYEAVRKLQKESVARWEKFVYRSQSSVMRHNPQQVQTEAITRIFKRLQCYESPVGAPAVRVGQPVLPPLPKEAFISKELLLSIIKPSLKTLVSFAETTSVNKAEHTSLDCTMLEILPLLYRSVETEVKLYAACDTHNPQAPKPSPDSLNCAGPATIRLKFCETKLNTSTEVAIKNNRLEMYTGVKRALQPPPYQIIVDTGHIEHVVREMEREWLELNRLGDAQLMAALKECGASVFYYLTTLFNDDMSSYIPLKRLMSTCIDTLGQCFISGDEQQGPVLLNIVLETPSLSPLLASHFEPARSAPPIYLRLYHVLLTSPQSLSQDFIFVLLSKFEMGHWLSSKKPRVSERSQLIELVGNALAKIGQNPPDNNIMVHEVLRRHLCVLMMYDAPEHYGEVIRMAQKHSESHCLSIDIWYDIINAMTSPCGSKFRPHMPLAQVVQETAKFATLQTLLSHEQLCELSDIVCDFYHNERLQYGLYGLYPKYRNYVPPITCLLGVLAHAVAVTSLHKHTPSNSLKVCEDLWRVINKLFYPWLCPYFTQSLTQPTAAWIQQLTDDRSILPPWIAADSGFAHKLAAIFTETIRFVLDVLPGCGEIFRYVWNFYVTYFAHASVKEYILSVMHSNLLSLPWARFYPTLNELDLMLKVSDTYVPYCHCLLGAIFVEIPWGAWMQMIPNDPAVGAKVHNALLHLFIKLANEPSVRQSGKIMHLLKESQNFQWELVDFTNYESVVNWFVMSYDPRVILRLEEQHFEIDYAALELLKVSAGYRADVKSYPSTVPRKRQVYIRACTKLFISSVSKYKALISTHKSKIEMALEDMLNEVESVVPKGNCVEAGLLLSELLGMLNLPEGHSLPALVLQSIKHWLSLQGTTVVAAALVRTAGIAVANSTTLGAVVEAALLSLFSDANGADWVAVKSYVQEAVPRHPPLEETLLANGHLLTLYSFLIKKLPSEPDLAEDTALFTQLTLWIASIKPCDVDEGKTLLLLHLSLYLVSRVCDQPSPATLMNLEKLVHSAQALSDHKPSWGLLGAIGLKKQSHLSNRFRLICKFYSLLLLNQMPVRKGDHSSTTEQFLRTRPHSPGGLTCNNIELVPREGTVKTRLVLEEMVSDKGFSELKYAAEHAIKLVEHPENAMHNAHLVFLELTHLIYNERFLNVQQLFSN